LAKITRLNAYNYYWKDDQNDPSLQTGILAQEVEKVFPELVKKNEQGYLSVNYSGLIPILIESTKEQQRQITTQQDQIKDQHGQIVTLKNELYNLKKLVEQSSHSPFSGKSPMRPFALQHFAGTRRGNKNALHF